MHKVKIFCHRFTQMNTDLDINKLTALVIGCAYRVGSTLGSGFLEKVYENALALDLRNAGIDVEQQYALLRLCLLINFGSSSVEIKRIINGV